ncbi:MAG: YraN family protein [Deltaproteobacteria bacterium]|nr:YraN family protein [Deltaproteobacteria bacterium]
MNNHKNTIAIGKSGEDFVCEKIVANGYKILARNVRERFAEIDIVAMDNDTLVFIEVRTRNTEELGHPSETVTPAKQNHIRRAAEAYIIKNKIVNTPIRFDVATIIWNRRLFEYFENAF